MSTGPPSEEVSAFVIKGNEFPHPSTKHATHPYLLSHLHVLLQYGYD
jgi:hypothetical protein